jgi:hypothetical protein
MLMIQRASAKPRHLRAAGGGDGPDVTFLNFGPAGAKRGWRDRPVPGGGEQAMRLTRAEAIAAFAAHPSGAGGDADIVGAGEGCEEVELAV